MVSRSFSAAYAAVGSMYLVSQETGKLPRAKINWPVCAFTGTYSAQLKTRTRLEIPPWSGRRDSSDLVFTVSKPVSQAAPDPFCLRVGHPC
jgi:hypothetical protein